MNQFKQSSLTTITATCPSIRGNKISPSTVG